MRVASLGLLLAAAPAQANMYDVISPKLLPPAGGCMEWAKAPGTSGWWVDPAKAAAAGSFCAQPGLGQNGSVHVPNAYCIGKASGQVEYCTSPIGVPEQVNVQVAGPGEVVAAFITFEDQPPSGPPQAEVALQPSLSPPPKTFTGVTHVHVTAGGRTYYMHFVKLSGLSQRTRHYYRVRTGADGAVWSDVFSFRAPYGNDGGETRIALYGDMGVYTYNNMGNLLQDTIVDESMDLIIHAGDHAYNMGDNDERRADAYMQAFEQTIANVPWMPVVGNHEYYANAFLRRFLDQTWQKWDPLPGGSEWGHSGLKGFTTADSALGAFLSAGNHHSAGVSSPVPSHTSRYFSVNFGQIHLVALSLNGYNGVDNCTDVCNEQQKEWLDKDLAAVNRTETPWVIVFSHFPLYAVQVPLQDDDVPLREQAWNVAEECEYVGHSRDCKPKGWKAKTGGTAYTIGSEREDLEPLFYKYGVDLYWAGHIHFYETFSGPMKNGYIPKGSPFGGAGAGYLIERCFTRDAGAACIDPKGVIHATSGNGGPPGFTGCKDLNTGILSRSCDATPSYTRLTAKNTTHLLWEQVHNSDGTVFDSWWVVQHNHGPFSLP